jgi:hypothetical protein
MKLRRYAVGLLRLSCLFYLTNCMGGNTTTSGSPDATIVISPMPTTVAAGTTVTFTATTTGTSYTPFWGLNLSTNIVGTLNPASGAGTSIAYTAPATPPIYPVSSSNTTQPQGTVILEAGVENTSGCGDATAFAPFIVTAPTVAVGLAPATANVSVNATLPLYGYAVGNIDGNLTWQVNGATGGNSAVGTITATSNTYTSPNVTYAAPSAIPMTGATITITMVSEADPTKTATTVITLH